MSATQTGEVAVAATGVDPRPAEPAVHRARPWWVFPVVAYLVAMALTWLVVALSSVRLAPNPATVVLQLPHGTGPLDGWAQWDSTWYQGIARHGYWYRPGQASPVAFFPAYPLAMRALLPIVRDATAAGIVLTVGSGLATFVLLYKWCLLRAPQLARLSIVLLAVYPYVWYLYGAVYADALFLAAALGCFVALETGHDLWAAVAGAVATAARPTGIAILAVVVVVALLRRRCVPLLAGLGLGAWCAYLWFTYGQPLLFVAVESAPGWDQPVGWRTAAKLDLMRELRRLPNLTSEVIGGIPSRTHEPVTDLITTLGLVLQLGLVLAAIAAIPLVWSRLGRIYGLYSACVVALPVLGSKDLQGSGRYLLAAFPVVVVVAALLKDRPRLTRVVVAASAVTMVVAASLYGRGYYLS